jgi:prepilin-type N-terminal cleavage/methylation domain-containing protein
MASGMRHRKLDSKPGNKQLPTIFRFLEPEQGFTLMEIIVATTIFAGTLTLMFSLFTYTLKINRKGEAFRQATQGMRNFTEFLTKEIRNGKIDFASGSEVPIGPCPDDSYGSQSTSLGLVSISGERQCIYWDNSAGVRALMIQKSNTEAYTLNPAYFTVEEVKFFVRPTTDPYSGTPPPRFQPLVTMVILFQVRLSPNETAVTIPYQTTISSDAYDVPQ